MTQWTKGTWRIEHDADGDFVLAGEGGQTLAVIGDYGETRLYEDAANANLIAAAPSMYEALEQLWGSVKTGKIVVHGEWEQEVALMLERALAALKLARGEGQ